MALATQALSCPQQYAAAVSTCSTSTPSSHDRVSSASGLRSNGWRRHDFTSNGVSVTVPGRCERSRRGANNGKWRAAASSEFQSTFTAKELERDAAKEALLLAVSCNDTLSLHLQPYTYYCIALQFFRARIV